MSLNLWFYVLYVEIFTQYYINIIISTNIIHNYFQNTIYTQNLHYRNIMIIIYYVRTLKIFDISIQCSRDLSFTSIVYCTKLSGICKYNIWHLYMILYNMVMTLFGKKHDCYFDKSTIATTECIISCSSCRLFDFSYSIIWLWLEN